MAMELFGQRRFVLAVALAAIVLGVGAGYMVTSQTLVDHTTSKAQGRYTEATSSIMQLAVDADAGPGNAATERPSSPSAITAQWASRQAANHAFAARAWNAAAQSMHELTPPAEWTKAHADLTNAFVANASRHALLERASLRAVTTIPTAATDKRALRQLLLMERVGESAGSAADTPPNVIARSSVAWYAPTWTRAHALDRESVRLQDAASCARLEPDGARARVCAAS